LSKNRIGILKKKMKSKQREVGVELPFTVRDTRTYETLCKEAKEAIQSTAADWIPRFCMALKRQHPLMASADIRKRVNNDWSSVWKGSTISSYWPDWMKNPAHVEAGRKGAKATNEKAGIKSGQSKQDTQQQEQKGESESESKPKTAEQEQRIKDEQRHDTQVDNICGYLMGLVELITGYKEEQILRLNDNLKLISETKQFRFNLLKALSQLDIDIIYRDARRAAIVLNAFLEQLDDELGSRKKKEALTSE